MLTHANILSVVAGQLGAINQVAGRYGEKFNQDDVMISYLPLAHIFDRCAKALICQTQWDTQEGCRHSNEVSANQVVGNWLALYLNLYCEIGIRAYSSEVSP
jgi:hypothetical protein